MSEFRMEYFRGILMVHMDSETEALHIISAFGSRKHGSRVIFNCEFVPAP